MQVIPPNIIAAARSGSLGPAAQNHPVAKGSSGSSSGSSVPPGLPPDAREVTTKEGKEAVRQQIALMDGKVAHVRA